MVVVMMLVMMFVGTAVDRRRRRFHLLRRPRRRGLAVCRARMGVDALDAPCRGDPACSRLPGGRRTAGDGRRTGRVVRPAYTRTVSIADVRSRRSRCADVDWSVEDDILDYVGGAVVNLTQLKLRTDVDASFHVFVRRLCTTHR